jgi:hypothetical protein
MRRGALALTTSGVTAGALYALAAGCNYDWTYVDEDASRIEGGAGKDGGGQDGRIDRDVPPEPPPPIGPPVGCKEPKGCPPGSFCHFKDGLCGKGAPGFCASLAECRDIPNPSGCTCDGRPIGDPCDAIELGSDIDPSGVLCGAPPPPPDGTFKCPGTAGCKFKVQYCVTKATAPGTGQCAEMPAGCTGCGCPSFPPSCTCAGPDGAVTLECR